MELKGETEEEEQETKRNIEGDRKKEVKKMCSHRQGGCLSWRLWKRRKQREKHKAASNSNKKNNILIYCISGCQQRGNN